MKKKNKVIRRASAAAISGAALIGILASTFGNDVQAATRLYGVQRIVQEMEENDKNFNILEIVPDQAMASMGFFGTGEGIVIDSKYLANASSVSEREEIVSGIVKSVNDKGIHATLNSYTEQLYVSDDDADNWSLLDLSDRDDEYETRTGHFAYASDLGVSAGNYTYSKKMFMTLSLVDENGNAVDSASAKYQVNDTVHFLLRVDSGRSLPEGDTGVLPAEVTIYGSQKGQMSSASEAWAPADAQTTDGFSKAGIISVADLYQIGAAGDSSYIFDYTIQEEDAVNGITLYAEGLVNKDADSDKGTYYSNKLVFNFGEKTTTTVTETTEKDAVITVSQTQTSAVTDAETGKITYEYQADFSSAYEVAGLAVYSEKLRTTAPAAADTENPDTEDPDAENPDAGDTTPETSAESDGKLTDALTWQKDGNAYKASITYSYTEDAPAEGETAAEPQLIIKLADGTQLGNLSGGTVTTKVEVTEQKEVSGYNSSVTSEKMEEPVNADDYRYTEGLGLYVWVDGNEEGDTSLTIPVRKVYYKTDITCDNLFAKKILELTEEADQETAAKVHVYSYTPAELESALINSEISLANIDLVYVSNSTILDTTGLVDGEGNSLVAAYGTDNDLSWATAFNIYDYMANINLPVIVDHSIIQDTTADGLAADKTAMTYVSEDNSGNNLIRLAYLLTRCYDNDGGKLVETAEDGSAPAEEIWTSDFVDGIANAGVERSALYGTYGEVLDCVYIREDDGKGSIVKPSISDKIFEYNSSANNSGEDVAVGMGNVVSEISNDNFYNNSNRDAYTVEYQEDNDGNEIITVSEATLVKYIINYNQRRITLYKDTINVLDLEPTKYSQLSESDIRGWLGIKEGYTCEASESNDTLSFNSATMKLSSSRGYTSQDYERYHSWSSDNSSVVRVNGSFQTGTLAISGEGTAVITHRYYVSGWHSETIKITVTKQTASETAIRKINITQLSTSEFIGRMEDLIENYDMIYIGACVGPYHAEGSLYQESSSSATTIYNDSNLKGKIYLHTGDLAVTTSKTNMRGLLNMEKQSVSSVSNRYSGNDITKDKYNELIEYAEAGYPVVIDSKLYNGTSVSKYYLDDSSYLYKLIEAVGSGYTRTTKIEESAYNKAVETYGSAAAAEAAGYEKTDISTYYHTHSAPKTAYKAERITNTNNLSSSDRYVIVNANTDVSDYAYSLIGKDLVLNPALKERLSGNTSAEIAEEIWDDSYAWTITKNYNSCYLQNADGNYLYMNSRDSATGAQTKSDSATLHVENSNQFSGSFFIYQNISDGGPGGPGGPGGYSSPAYLNARTENGVHRAGTWNSGDRGSSWYIYKITETTSGTTQVTDEISKTQYDQAVAQYGDQVAANGYTKVEAYTYTYSYSHAGVPNAMADNSNGTTLNKLVKYINMPRLNLVLTSTPTEYESTTNTDGTLKTYNYMQAENGKYYLNYEFEFSNSSESAAGASRYSLSLFVDVNADGRYVAAEELDGVEIKDANGNSVAQNNLQSGVRYTAKRELPQDYVGLLPWKLIISLNTTGQKSTVRASQIGYTNVKNTSGEKTEIKVLQILPGENSGLSLTDPHTYFPSLIGSVNTALNYNIQVTTTWASAVNSKASSYGNAQNFYKKYLDQFDMLIWGYSDMYGSKDFNDIAINGFGLFIDAGKSTLFSHDLTSFNNGYYGNGTSDWGYHMNLYLRSVAGMDRYGITTGKDTAGSLSSVLSAKTGTYTMSDTEKALVEAKKKDTASKPNNNVSGDTYKESQGFTSTFLDRELKEENSSKQYSVYRSSYSMTTTSISETNEGQITRYPFDITIEATDTATGENYMQKRTSYSGDSSYYVEQVATATVGTTHSQYYQLDFNYDTDGDGTNNLVVWYSLAGGSYSASPNDARNDYYIYSVGNVTYTGMGHSYSSSDVKNSVSLKEAQLFVNTIVAAYNAGIKKPSVNIVSNAESKNTSIDYIYRTFDENRPSDNSADESFAYYVNDTNMIQGTKTINTFFCHEISAEEYQKANGAAGYYVTNDGSKTVYLKKYTTEELSSILSSYETVVENNITTTVVVKASWINSRLTNNSIAGNATLWIGAVTTLDYSATNKDTAYTDPVFDSITFKVRNLINLD